VRCRKWQVAAAALSLITVAGISSAAPVTGQKMTTRSLVVVIWERRAPKTEHVAAHYGQVQKQNREALLSLLYDGPHALVQNPRATVVAVYPEGTESFALQRERFQQIETMTPAQIWSGELRNLVSSAGAADEVRGIFHDAAPAKDELDLELRRNITFPLTGLRPDQAGVTGLDESNQRGANPSAARSVCSPPLVTAWTLNDAAQQASAIDELLSPVYVIWVHGGERNYAITNPRQRIYDDYGVSARALYIDTLKLYSLLPDETHGVDGEMADGNVVVWRVLPRRAVREPPQADVRIGHMTASFNAEETTVWSNPLLGDGGARASFRRAVDSLQWPRWTHRLDSTDYNIAEGQFRFVRSGLTAPIAADGSVDGGLRNFIERAFPMGDTSWTVDDDVVAETLLEPAIEDDVPAYLRGAALRIPVRHRTRPAPVSIHLASLSPAITWLAAFFILVALCVAYVRLRHRFAPRALFASLDFDGDEQDDVIVQGPRTTSITNASLSLLDRSGFRPRHIGVPISATLTSPIGDVALTGKTALHTFDQHGNAIETSRRPSRRGSKGNDIPMQIRLQGGALDFARLSAGEEVHGAYTITVAADDPKGAYEPFRQVFARQFRLRIEASPPKYEIEIVPSEPVRRLGFFGDPEADPASLERSFGQLLIRNPPLKQGVALTINIAIENKACLVDGEDEKLDVWLYPNRESGANVDWSADRDDMLNIRNNGVAVYDIFLRLPDGEKWKSREKWTVRIAVKMWVGWAGAQAVPEERVNTALWMPVGARSFACLDLGTSATRLLVQGQEDEKFGYIKFPAEVRYLVGLPEDLPSTTWIDLKKGRVLFGRQASLQDVEHDGDRKLHSSLKELMLSGSGRYGPQVELYVERFLLDFYKPSIHDVDANQPAADVTTPYSSARPEVWRGPRHILIGTVPNEASQELIEAYEKGVAKSGLFRRFLVMREAEAAAFGFLHEEAARRPHGDHALKVLVVDVGAGSTDIALIESTPRELRVLSRSGVQVAGNHIDRAILKALPKASSVNPSELVATTPDVEDRLLEQAQGLKAAMAARKSEWTFTTDNDSYQIPAEQLDAIYESAEYQQAMREVIEEPLLMLLGRVPEPSVFDSVDVLLLTGRGALMRGVRDQLDTTLRTRIHPRRVAFDERGNGTFLKAAVTLGARVFGLGPWPAMTLSNDTFADRIVFVAATPDGPRQVEILSPGQRFNERGIITGEKMLPFQGWSDGVLVRTFLRGDEALGSEVALTTQRLEAILQRTPITGLRMPAYAPIKGVAPKRSTLEGPASLSVAVHTSGRIEWRLRDRKKAERTRR
jgi:actin-like ATPase involved in cell morphogenesis